MIPGRIREWAERPWAIGTFVGVAILLPVLALGAFTRGAVLGQLTSEHDAERLQTAAIASGLVAAGLASARDALELSSRRVLLRDALARRDAIELARHVGDLRATLGNVNSAAAFSPQGVMLAREPRDDIVGQSFADRDYFTGALASSAPFVSEMFLSRAAPTQPLVAVAVAVREEGAALGVIQVTLTPAGLLPLLQPVANIPGRHFVVADVTGRVVASTGGEIPMAETPVAATRAAGSGTGRVALPAGERHVAFVPVDGTGWTLYAVDDPVVVLAALREMDLALSVGFGLTVIALGAGAFAIGATIAQRQRTAILLATALETQRRANRELEALSRQKDEFVSIVSHEFRTPLTGILGFSEMLRDEDLPQGDVRAFASDIHLDAQRLSRLIEDMLDLDRMGSGRMRIERAPVDVNDLIREVAAKAQSIAPGHTIRTELGDIPHIEADRDRITQVLTNLVSNAVKYSPDGGEVLIRSERRNGWVHVSVSDRGIGIPEDALSHIFDRFARVESSRTRAIRGTGLGLAIVRQIVELHGGTAWAESALGKGTTLHVELPLGIAFSRDG